MGPDQLALMIPIIAVSIPIVAIWTKHQQRMAEIRTQQGTTIAPDVRAEIERLQNEVASLRETTTRFDMSFDAALTRLEDRMDDRKPLNSESTTQTRSQFSGEAPSETVSVGRGRS